MKYVIWKRNVRKRILPDLMNILTTLGMETFSPNLGDYGKPFLKLLVQVMFSVNGMYLTVLTFTIRFPIPTYYRLHDYYSTCSHSVTNTHTQVCVGLVDDRPVAETSNWQDTTLTCLGRIWTRNPSKRAAADPHLRPRGHLDRREEVNKGKI
jgi:hypothetical protein